MSKAAITPVVLELPSLTPALVMEILPYGLTVHRLYVQTDGKTHDILIGPENASDYLDTKHHKYVNSIIGRYSNRLPVGTHEIERHGFKFQFTAQGNQPDPKASMHGGPKGFDDVEWTILHPSQAILFSDGDRLAIGALPASVVFSYTSLDGDQGFPGTLYMEVLTALINPSRAQIDASKDESPLGSVLFMYRARLQEGNKVTPVNLTQHWGFNLEASLQEDESNLNVKNHKLSIKAYRTIDLDASSLSTGKLLAVQDTPRHHASKPIDENFPASGYDKFYVFSQSASTPIPKRFPESDLSKSTFIQDIVYPRDKSEEPALVELSSDKSGLKLSFSSNQSGVQFYSSNGVQPDSSRKRIHGGSGKADIGDGYRPGAAAFLEFHAPLAAWLHPGTSPSSSPDDNSLLASGELYNNFVKMDVTYRPPRV